MTLLYAAACVVLLYSAFCRAVQMDRTNTRPEIRVVFVGVAGAAAYGLAALIGWGYKPDWPDVALGWSFAAVQVVTSRGWLRGVPERYRRHA